MEEDKLGNIVDFDVRRFRNDEVIHCKTNILLIDILLKAVTKMYKSIDKKGREIPTDKEKDTGKILDIYKDF